MKKSKLRSLSMQEQFEEACRKLGVSKGVEQKSDIRSVDFRKSQRSRAYSLHTQSESLSQQNLKRGSKRYKHYRPSGMNPRYMTAVTLNNSIKVDLTTWCNNPKDALKSR